MANTRLRRDVSSSGSDTKGTISAWVKRSKLGTNQVFICGKKSNTERVAIGFSSEDRFEIQFQDTSNAYNWRTNALYRDTFAWYNCVIQLDTGNATATSRARVWINNEEITSWNVQETVPQNLSIGFSSSNNVPHVGARGGVTVDKYFDGIISHLHFIDATAYDATAFGQYDANGVWTINTSPSVTYGTNGFFILKDGNSVTDQSPNTNNFTVADGTLTKTEDNPSNVFANINSLVGNNLFGSTVNFSNGNTTVEDPSGSASGVNPYFMSTLAMPSKGKFYCELKPSNFSSGSGHSIGIFRTSSGNTSDVKSSSNKTFYIWADLSFNMQKYGSLVQSGLTGVSSGQIVGMALDLDNGTLQYYVNGVARGSQITGVNSANDGYDYFFYSSLESSSSGRYGKYEWNFGNGYFGTTAVASAGTNASGIGIFEYDVPTGYTALSTKGLNL